jgi:hypothetical protein
MNEIVQNKIWDSTSNKITMARLALCSGRARNLHDVVHYRAGHLELSILHAGARALSEIQLQYRPRTRSYIEALEAWLQPILANIFAAGADVHAADWKGCTPFHLGGRIPGFNTQESRQSVVNMTRSFAESWL